MQWLSTVVIFISSFIFGILSHRSSKRDWDFIKEGPALVLFVISSATAQVEIAQERAQRMFRGDFQVKCETIVNDGWPENGESILTRECEFTSPEYVPDDPETIKKEFFDWLKDSFVSVYLDIPPEAVGIWIGNVTSRRFNGGK